MDGRSFIRQQCSQSPHGVQPQDRTDAEPAQPSGAADASLQPALAAAFDHAIMNLPASAIEFLDAFHGAFNSRAHLEEQLPLMFSGGLKQLWVEPWMVIYQYMMYAWLHPTSLTVRIPAAVAFAKRPPPSESVATIGKPFLEDKSVDAADSGVSQHSKRRRT
ncbi:TPA: tRNA(m(1)G37)methyltransferase [Trebouxia sp. C0006]